MQILGRFPRSAVSVLTKIPNHQSHIVPIGHAGIIPPEPKTPGKLANKSFSATQKGISLLVILLMHRRLHSTHFFNLCRKACIGNRRFSLPHCGQASLYRGYSREVLMSPFWRTIWFPFPCTSPISISHGILALLFARFGSALKGVGK